MKFKSWVELHVGRPRRKKEKSSPQVKKKSSELSVTLPPRSQLDSAGNSPTSPQLPPRGSSLLTPSEEDLSQDVSTKRFFHGQNVSPAIAYLSPFRVSARGSCACASFSGGLLPSAFPCTCYPSLEDPYTFLSLDEFRRLNSVRTSVAHAAQLNSPRQRSHIRTNPWLTPKASASASFRTSSSSSECGSASEGDASVFVACSGSDEITSPTSTNRHSFTSTDEGGCSDITPSSDDVSLVSPVIGDSDSSSDECETLNELGQFEENYEYERETDILDDDTDDDDDEDDDDEEEESNVRGRRMRSPIKWDEGSRTPTAEEPIEFADGVDETKPLTANIVIDEDDDDEEEDDSRGHPDASTIDESNETSEPTPSRRTLGQIRESLEEKVRRLRLERLIVEDKIREAREEERLRREEKIKFQKQLILHRRQILLRTLQNLREKLEDQSLRLQDAYSATLEMQLQVRRQLKNRTATGKETTHEAPF